MEGDAIWYFVICTGVLCFDMCDLYVIVLGVISMCASVLPDMCHVFVRVIYDSVLCVHIRYMIIMHFVLLCVLCTCDT